MFETIACFRSSIRNQHELGCSAFASIQLQTEAALPCNFQLLIEPRKRRKNDGSRHFHRSNIYSNIPHYRKKPSAVVTKSSVHQRFMPGEAFVTISCNFSRAVPSNFPQNKSIKRDRQSASFFFSKARSESPREKEKDPQRICNCCTKTHNHSSVQHGVQPEIKIEPYGRDLFVVIASMKMQ
jgi:hypothetical protein